ncbi:hypothetical protein METBIDRAFT_133826 [Metschnikowia bicuspidata var. bicuspidata NRRL YB-4993]|uniref:DNA polymerase n=1 Tax=Metschnikowia bicuspidata var. bicuspidata NRRL YB-4993 TaxID=869754 RepID=A0A1A0HKD6_9ASCO|nr:hypothetical protein METBIDRAFT_133826 [Metschnikowia bicuspidata var. bicuspidata NRRL YB-4993]OBA24466.1 hypothetical protein METBIDRAFT_133826 [Metschnikowia bicuspidata var. bicuspidata NRRL YB-4993]
MQCSGIICRRRLKLCAHFLPCFPSTSIAESNRFSKFMTNGLSIQINDLDSYHLAPLHLDQFQLAPKVPIIRIYGTLRVPDLDLAAYNILVHIHNYYPYLYIDCLETDDSKLNDTILARLTLHLEKAIGDSFKRKQAAHELSDDSSDGEIAELDNTEAPQNKYIACIKLCRGSPVYGYKVGYLVVFKILFFLPLYKTRLFKLLGLNAIDFQDFTAPDHQLSYPNVYEAHLNYLSQFLADFNLHPCGYLRTANCHFRLPIINHNGLRISPLKKYLATYILRNNVLNSSTFPRMSRSLLEIDCHVGDILNRLDLRQRNVHDEFTEYTRGCATNVIFLSSLRLTLDDLKYQCAIREKNNTTQLLTELYSQVFTKLGQSGYCDWESRPQQEQQLSFVLRLNKPTPFFDVSLYYENIIGSNLKGKRFPTTFELVDENLPMKCHENVPLLNYRDDLINWTSYELLFEAQNADATLESIEQSQLTKDIELKSPVSKKPDISTPPVSPEQQHSHRGIMDLSPEVSPAPKRSRPSENNHVDKNHNSAQREDWQIFMLTQHNVAGSIECDVESSTGSILSQTSHEILVNPKNTWECVLPAAFSRSNLSSVFKEQRILDFNYSDPSYDDTGDVHNPPLIFANRIIPVPFIGDTSNTPVNISTNKQLTFKCVDEDAKKFSEKRTLWQYSVSAPTRDEVTQWTNLGEESEKYKKNKYRSQIEPLFTQTNDYKYSLRTKNIKRNPSGFLNMTLFGMELHVNTTDGMLPDPRKDPIQLIIYHFDNSNQMYEDGRVKTGILAFAEAENNPILSKIFQNIASLTEFNIKTFSSERQMVEAFVQIVDQYDPDILSGYEVNASSWGYLCERFQEFHGVNLIPRLSKVNFKGNGKLGDRWGYTHTSALKINGRHLFNVWRFLKDELKLTSYSLENICFHLLHRTLPKILGDQLSAWYTSGSNSKLLMVCNYYMHRMDLIMDIIESQEMVLRNVELSRLLGVDFYSNYYRGSQFKVESLLMRIAKTENALLNSPSKAQVHAMRPLEVVPLIMEPESNFYKSPLVVLDFQSLYPSIMIAYNYCYSTLIGRIEGYRQDANTVGYLKHHSIPKGLIDLLIKNNGLNISPNGMMFVSPKFRKSILSRMLQEILNMRINVKSVASAFRNDKELGKLLNSKQLALKLIANVTYGYTSATFSGRMPNSDIADAIVSTGRELMKRSIEIIEASPYNAKVTYGDTDSLFVYFPGRSREFAFKYGKLLADQITEALPDPVKLKFEKVYHPSVLLAKKRYVGHCYEFEDQKIPTFEAKGIETIRRDGIPAQLKMVGKSLRILFETKNLSAVKRYVVKQFFKILLNKVNASDFCFAKGVRYGTYKNEKHLPPGAVVAKKKIERDPRSEPQYKERVPYLVMKDSTKERLRDRCVPPELYMSSYNTESPMELDFDYYITKVLIPPLERIFNLMGVNVKEWYRDMPKSTKQVVMKSRDILKISGFMRSEECVRCGCKLDGHSKYICRSCRQNELELVNDLTRTGRDKEGKVNEYQSICNACSATNFKFSGNLFSESCINQDCRTYFAKVKAVRECEQFMSDKFKIFDELRSSAGEAM